MAAATVTMKRRADLRDGWLENIERLRRCHASEIPEDFIDDYLAMSWLQWNGGALKLTELGENVRLQLVREL
jgi:hypothetical protein